MFTQIKLSREQQESPTKVLSGPQQFQGDNFRYDFLRNMWATHFNGRENASIQDKIDKINKVVGMVKSQIKIMTTHQEKQRQNIQKNHYNYSQRQVKDSQTLQLQLEKIKQAYQRSQMRNQQLEYLLYQKDQKIKRIQDDNYELKDKLADIKRAKNSCEQIIIQLSKRIYELQRHDAPFVINLEEKDEEENTNLSVYSAFTNEPQSIQRPKLIERNRDISTTRYYEEILRFDNKVLEQQKNFKEISQFEELGELNLNLPNTFRLRERNSYTTDGQNMIQLNEKGLIGEIKKMKKKAQKMVQLQSQRQNNQYYRKTFDVLTQRPKINHQTFQKEKRFRRIR